jgi:predicted DNA-binding transcriptional regulator AlpA
MSADNQGGMTPKQPSNVSIFDKLPEDEIADMTHGSEVNFSSIRLHQLPDDFMLSKQELAKVLGCSCRTIDRMVKCGDIPPGTPILGRKVWFAGKVRAWIAGRAARLEAEAVKEAQRLRIVLH